MQNLSVSDVKTIQSIFLQREATRLGVSKHLGFSLVNVLSILNRLEENNYIKKTGTLKSKPGRPSYTYGLEANSFYALGISMEFGSYRIIGINASKETVYDKIYTVESRFQSPDFVDYLVDHLADSINRIKNEFIKDGRIINAVCAALIGMVDSNRGLWLLGLQLGGINNVAFAEKLEKKIGTPVFIEDNSRSLTFFEQTLGKGYGYENFIVLYLGKGVGSGIVIENRIYDGYHGIAGEIGHIPLGNNNYRCSCGNIGCLEAVISASGIIRVINDRLKEGVVSILQRDVKKKNGNLTIEDIRAAGEEGDRFAISTLFEIGQYIGDACSTLIKLFNPQRIIISGACSILESYFAEATTQRIKQNVILEMLSDYETIFADYDHSHEAKGAALIGLNKLWDIETSREV